MGGHESVGESAEPLRVLGEVLTSPESRAFVAEREHDDRIVGYAEIHAHVTSSDDRRDARLTVLAIAPEERRSGLGAALIAEAENAARMLGCTTIVLDSSNWREDAHAFYLKQGFSEKAQARRFFRPIPPRDGSLEERFLFACGNAASAVKAAIAGMDRVEAVGLGADGAPTEAADRAAENAALNVLLPLGLPIVSEEAGLVGADSVDESAPWISLDPLDGSRNFVSGYPPYAIAIGLVENGRVRAGFVCDLSTGHRWWAANGNAWRDGRRLRHRDTSRLVAIPSPIAATPVISPFEGFSRVRIAGSSTIELCRVAEGSAGAFVSLSRPVIHAHDLAGPLAIILEAGAMLIDGAGEIPVIVPDPARTYEVVAASSLALARSLLERGRARVP